MSFFENIRRKFPQMLLMEAETLAKHTSFQIGGEAPMGFPSSCEELAALYRFCRAEGIGLRILGAGTNILAPDEGLSELVICTKNMTAIQNLGGGEIEAECGVLLSRLACYARDRSLTGLEFAHGIPGTVGGGIYMNAGAYGGEMAQVAVRTEAMMPDGSICTVSGEEHQFGYRRSVFEETGAIVLKTVFCLQPGQKEQISETMQELAAKRRSSQPLEYPSAGSTFKRPAGGYAAALIDEAGLRGTGVGGALVSEKHAGFVINKGGATAKDVLETMKQIQKKVLETSGIALEPEVRIW